MSVENLEGEIWKVIDHPSIGCYPNHMVSSLGRIKSVNYRNTGKERLFKGVKDKDGYLRVHLSCDGKAKIFGVHRLVALMFIPNPNPEDKPCVNHKSEIKSENFAVNLEWVSVAYNNAYGSKGERTGKALKNSLSFKKAIAKRRKQVFQYSENGKLVNIYPSTMEIERQTGFSGGFISDCCNGKHSTGYNFVWSFTELTRNQISVLFASRVRNKPVYQYTTDGELVNIHLSAAEIEKQTGFQHSAISLCCNGKKKTYKNFIWSYEPLPNTTNQLTLFPLTEKKIS